MFRFNSGARGRLCFAKMDVVRVILLLCFPAGSDKIKTNYKNCFYFEGRCGMPKVAYSEEDRERIRAKLIAVGLELMAEQGIQHTTVEQIYKKLVSRVRFSIPFLLQKRI